MKERGAIATNFMNFRIHEFLRILKVLRTFKINIRYREKNYRPGGNLWRESINTILQQRTVVTFFNHDFVNCIVTLIFGIKNLRNKIQYKPKCGRIRWDAWIFRHMLWLVCSGLYGRCCHLKAIFAEICWRWNIKFCSNEQVPSCEKIRVDRIYPSACMDDAMWFVCKRFFGSTLEMKYSISCRSKQHCNDSRANVGLLAYVCQKMSVPK